MREPLDVALTFPAEMNEADVTALLTVVKQDFDIIDDGRSNFNADWVTIIALLKDGAEIVGGLGALASLANTLIAWRTKTVRSGRPTPVRIKVSGLEEIDLESVSDDEIRRLIERPQRVSNDKIFIVHGHDNEAKQTLARFISQLGLQEIILNEQASRNQTIIEKLEANSDVGFAVVLLTPDDEGRAKGAAEFQERPRQNVVAELGYFIGRLKRNRVCALVKGDLDIPSDFSGVGYVRFDAASNHWKVELARELKAAGYELRMEGLLGG
jgi:predicted nucleotide-binding protein